MAQSTARVLALLEVLQSGGTRTLAELSRRLEVDKRTVRRYVEQLRELDIPIESVRGRYGGYRLDRHFRMPPLMLDDDEAVAVFWSLLTSRHASDGPTEPAAVDSAIAKVRRVLPSALGRRIDAVRQTVTFAAPTTTEHADGGATLLLDLAAAVRDRRPVAFAYVAGSGESSQRTVHPAGVVAHGGRLYLAGYDTAKQAARTFRLDRMTRLRQLDATFAETSIASTVDQVLGPLPPSPGRHDVSVLVAAAADDVQQFMPDLLASVGPAEPPMTAPTPDSGAGWVRVLVRAEDLNWVARRLAAIDRPFVVEHPAELTDAIAALAGRLQTSIRR